MVYHNDSGLKGDDRLFVNSCMLPLNSSPAQHKDIPLRLFPAQTGKSDHHLGLHVLCQMMQILCVQRSALECVIQAEDLYQKDFLFHPNEIRLNSAVVLMADGLIVWNYMYFQTGKKDKSLKVDSDLAVMS
ncbi:hypothetical protein llap_7673 [Limosa lapponica baueri]|uniref:Uncharacterized protein n=1 Tax=Limosa lapponica baueri TaxID=1758121 RepID=A0A2I0U7J9_LIMLA|nr:hypothetical protein llap_7673 [Limosa lapponica baueri]